MYKTKERIVNASIKLFNDHGIASVRLQQIADEIGISVGNLAYHFKNKEAIIHSVYEKLFEDFQQILGSYLKTPSLLDFDSQISHYFDFFKNYQFYISDLFASEHPLPEVREQWQEFMNKMIFQIRKRLDFHARRGDLSPQPENTYDILAEAIWMTLVFWIPQQQMRNKPISEARFKGAVWNNIRPYLTEKGTSEFASQILPIFI
ncbi:transcriptional regulator, TetR family [Emticicia oligotrophica DSM 17448]|uniref:Transcriptional regulator, TetR family n=1 Tax=Emticicia oligotrophica (strain DSM 17448 / CIP 109782 / MTCC 6937 / GPTSA100-15) TaxID=929562 RepID=A0ABN4AP13_EMTOG|nr:MULTISPECIES: TetR/AcrR family transcriptional regulator [Emticicia]AFK03948.1 transcriptional regulator, TetR family [Emticicia oligotrophica DSM 17448]